MNIVTNAIRNALVHLGPDCDKQSGMVLIGNGKTGKSLENGFSFLSDDKMKGGCPLMTIKDGIIAAPKCPSCYAAAILNRYPGLRQSLTAKQTVFDIVSIAAHAHPTFKNKLAGVPIFPGDRLRCYGVTDFQPANMPALRLLSKVYKIDIISKTLWMSVANRKHLIELANMENINISLSFNKELGDWRTKLKEMIEFVRENNIGHSVGFNYTFTSDFRRTGKSVIEPVEHIEGIGVYHIVSKNKDKITFALGDESRTCGIFNAEGDRIKAFGVKGGEKGSCLSCNFCRKNVLNEVLPIAS